MLFGLILAIVTFAACCLFALRPVWFPLPISHEAVGFDRQFGWTLWITAVIFIAVQVLLVWAVVSSKGRQAQAPTHHRQRWIEAVWGLAAAALFITLGYAGSRDWARVSGADGGKETIEVYAHQFAWNFRYPGPDRRFGRTELRSISDSGGNPLGLDAADPAGKDDIVTANLCVPAGRDVLLLLHSRDVIHDFSVRELRTKQDIVPGMETRMEIHVDRPGEYEIACAQLCGMGHSQMRSLMIAMEAAAYDRWKAGRGESCRSGA